MDNFSGQVIKGYELKERIGAGGFGAVYKAHQSTVGREVAMKIILPHFANHPDFIRRFETEAQMIARLEHLHITPLYDYWRDPNGAYLVMRWLRGGSLRDALQQGAYSLESSVRLVDQVASALAAAHGSGIIHRDLKPGNILLDEDSNAYLADFGIAKDLTLNQGATDAEAVMGSPDYLSPEQARSEAVTPATDVYSFGVVLYEMLAGAHPFPGLSAVERMYKHLSDSLPLIETLEPHVRDAVNAVIQKATAKNPAHRYGDTLALAEALRQAAALASPSSSLVEVLTQREQEILGFIIDGRANKEIADKLYVTVATVKWYITQIYRKLGVRSRVQAIVRARELQLITPGKAPDDALSLTGAMVIPTDQFQPTNPYKGLRAFRAADAHDFFGREKLVEKLVIRLREIGEGARFLTVIGPSGSGKSSLVKAGLIPALWRGELAGSEKWFVVEMLPGPRPLDELEVALTRVAASQSGNLREQLARDRFGLMRAAGLILPDDGSELVLVIDQFEEVFTLVDDEAARLHFLSLLQTAVTEARSRVRVVLTLRADFYDRPLQYPEFGELVRSRMETVLPLGANALERAIARPAEQVGVRFEEGLVASIVAEVNYQPGALPLLQYALTELFERRQGHLLTHEAYAEIGGTVGALAKRADAIYDGLDDSSKEAARQMFLRLVTLGEGVEDTRRRVTRSELMAVAASEEAMDEIIDTYAEFRLLSLDHEPATRSPTVEFAHEAILREWERLRLWLEKSRDDIRLQRQVGALAAEWSKAMQNASYLARGSRLEQLTKWANDTELALTPAERAYLDASAAQLERETHAEAQRQAREKELERRSQTFQRILMIVLLLATIGAFGLTGVAVNQSNLAQAERDNAQANFRRAEAQRLAAEAKGLVSMNGSGDLVALLAMRSMQTQYTAQGDEALIAASLLDYPVQLFVGHTDRVKAVGMSPDGRMLLTGSGDSTVRLWDVETGHEIRQFAGDMQDINSAMFSPDGRTILTGSRFDNTVRLWDVETGEELQRFTQGNGGAFALDGRRIFVHSEDNYNSMMIDLETGAVLHEIPAPQEGRRPETTGYSPDGTLYADIPLDEGMAYVRRVVDDEAVLSIPLTNYFENLAFSSDNRLFAINGEDRAVDIWDLDTGDLITTLGGTEEMISFAFSPDNRLLAVGEGDGSVQVWDARTGQELHRYRGHTLSARHVAFSQDGRYLLSGSFDQRALLWELSPAASVPHMAEGNTDLINLAASADGTRLAASAGDGSVKVWDAGSGALIWRVAAGTETAWFIGFTPDNGLLVTGAETVRVWDMVDGSLVNELDDIGTMATINLFDVTADWLLVSYGADEALPSTEGDWAGGVIAWNLRTGEEVRRYATPVEAISGVMSPDERWLVAYTNIGYQAALLDAQTGEQVGTFQVENHISDYRPVFSPDSRLLFAGGSETSVLWDVERAELRAEIVGHRDMVISAAFSHDARLLATSSWDSTVRLWDTETGQEVRRITFPFNPIHAAFSASDATLFVLGSDGTVHTVYADVEPTMRDLCGRLLRDFTPEEREQYEIADETPTCT